MDWIESESFWLGCPDFADELVWREAFEGLESSAEIVGADEVGEMGFELAMAVVVVAFDGRFLDGLVHSLDLSVCPRVINFRQPMFDSVLATDAVKQVHKRPFVFRSDGKLNAVVS